MGIAQDRLASLLREVIAPRLRERGYRGSGQNFHRRFDSHWGVINIQRSQWDWAERATFTINLGVASDAIRNAFGEDLAKPPTEAACHWRARIGELASWPDTWWEIRDDTTDEAAADVADEVWRLLSSAGLQAVEEHADDSVLLAHLLEARGPSFLDLDVTGVLLAHAGGTDAQRSRFDEMVRDARAFWRSLPDERRPAMGPKRTAAGLELLRDPRAAKRIEAAHLLGASRDPEAREALRAALEDPDERVRLSAAGSLANLDDRASLQAILELVVGASDRFAVAQLAGELARLATRDPRAGAEVAAALRARLGRAVGIDLVGVFVALERIG